MKQLVWRQFEPRHYGLDVTLKVIPKRSKACFATLLSLQGFGAWRSLSKAMLYGTEKHMLSVRLRCI